MTDKTVADMKTGVEPLAPPRADREMGERAVQAREPETFVPPGILPKVKKEPGYEYRWIRFSDRGSPDNSNVNSRFMEGWKPVDPSEQPEIVQFHKDERYGSMIEHGGLVLCKISKEKAQARKDYYKRVTLDQTQAVDNNFMRQNDSRMPLFKERSTSVKTGSR